MRVIFNFEHRCSMRCTWCYIPFGRPPPDQALALQVIRRLAKVGFTQITIGGGDPTSYSYWKVLVAEARSLGLFVHMDTNAIGLRKDTTTAEVLRSNVGLLGLPLDGARASVHDAVRSTNRHFDRVISSIKWATAAGLSVKINTIITAANIGSALDMIPLVGRLSPSRWSIYQYWPLSFGLRAQKVHELADSEFNTFAARLPQEIGETFVEPNARLIRKRTYPLVSHDGRIYVHSADQTGGFLTIGSVFDDYAVQLAIDKCGSERPLAISRYE